MTEKAEKEYRRGVRVTTTDPLTGALVKLVPDENGVIAITSDAMRRVADARGYSVTKLPKMSNAEVGDLQKKNKEG